MRITPHLRLPAPIHRIVWLSLFAGALAIVPVRTVTAQDQPAQPVPAPSSAAQSHPEQAAAGQAATGDAANLSTQPSHVKAEEREENNVYRHTPLVQKLADIFHLDVETAARLFEFINFAIIVLAIVIPLGKFLPKVIRKRSITLSDNLEVARKTTSDANARLSAVEAQLSRLDEEIAKIRAQVEEESKQDEVRIKATIEEEHARIVASAEQEIGAAAAHAQRNLRHFAADLAIEQAVRQMALTPETDRALINEFISEAQNKSVKGGNGAAREGKN